MENAAVDISNKKKHCEQHMHRYVMVQTIDGVCCDGIVEHVDEDMVYIAVPYCPNEYGRNDYGNRPFHGGHGFGHGFGGGFYPRRFFRRGFPFGSLLALSLLPYYYY
ncbi:hypothetical protein [Paenibacillus sp. L3-i20]|uniref:hypothetical protein n=1 Tax=Paenibacillus sp. L3-i20 TaxID=2905833 RepID=UPI001EDD4CB8|nr:hypothetical protein [Paenibacillus sp. L3-i20]GKU79723.1 hypothetical protein L3i20_v241200 [Paenibacillus sp. L3-i20]